MLDPTRLLYIHGSDTDSNSNKARLFRGWFPGMVTPDFRGSFEARMNLLRDILATQTGWTVIGSSYGGLMATVYALENERALRRLVLLAPALMLDAFVAPAQPNLITVPTIVIHGTLDTVIPLEPVRQIAQNLFANLTYHIVEDDHRLYKTANELDWKSILDS